MQASIDRHLRRVEYAERHAVVTLDQLRGVGRIMGGAEPAGMYPAILFRPEGLAGTQHVHEAEAAVLDSLGQQEAQAIRIAGKAAGDEAGTGGRRDGGRLEAAHTGAVGCQLAVVQSGCVVGDACPLVMP